MFVPRSPSVNLPPYQFDPYAPGSSSSYVVHGMHHHQMYPSLPQYMPSPYTPTPYNYNMPYSGDPSFMNLLTMSHPHVPFPQPHTGSQYFGMVPPPIFGSISSRGESSEAPEKRINLLDVIQCKTSHLNNLNRMYKHNVQLDKEYVRFASPSNNVNVTAGIDLHDEFLDVMVICR
ncbi:hypothetical protein Scep_026122 [Stephania cephalantha]|uniref:Uncharacterized protein n=1 Tax=Stephania cephalantha TaxID=152367 RepID=A0AAP0EQ44_9MAGN